MEEGKKLSTQEKALRINLSRTIYGSFAEIGAGQEVAANFFKVGGASGTVAKTISAYDMKFSDAIYGQCERYVCEDRLLQMLDHEYHLLPERLPDRAPDTRFFAFADTVEALNYERTNQGQGWLGLRFQLHPETAPNELVIHVKLHDNDALQQQIAVGILGVNILYGALFLKNPQSIILSLLDGLNSRRVEVDMFRLTGPDYQHADNRLLALQLVKNGLTKAAMFGPDGTVLQPSEALYKKNVLVIRGRFRPPTLVNMDMLHSGMEQFARDPEIDREKMLALCELTLRDLSADGSIDENDFLHRAEILCSLGQTVLISNYVEYHRLAEYLIKLTRGRKIGLVLGIYGLQSLFDEKNYDGLKGGILESFAALFGSKTKLFIYPSLRRNGDGLFTLNDFSATVAPNLTGLFRFLLENHKIEDMSEFRSDHLHIISDDVLEMIRNGKQGWEEMVPEVVYKAIKSKALFGFKT
ncbi:MAG: TonB-dependent receptor [Bacteroidetes bacterium]|nr:TonB-dependent receptor [Bacteroidota bacterium]